MERLIFSAERVDTKSHTLEMEGRCLGVFALLLLKLATGLCDESSEEASQEVIREEYGQIFHSLPTLFEYVLEILHQRPEILEKDDVTFFQEIYETCEEGVKRKRDVDTQCNNEAKQYKSKDKSDLPKRNIVVNDLKDIGNMNDGSNGSEDDVTTTTNNKSTDGNGLHKPATKNKSKSKTNKIISENNKNEVEANVIKSKTKLNTEVQKGKIKVKKNAKFGESFLGSIDWSKFYLTSDEVEEQTLKAERAIEEHNRNKRK